MASRTDHKPTGTQADQVCRHTPKKPSTVSKRRQRIGLALQSFGVALSLACPYLYFSFMVHTQQAPLPFVRWLMFPALVTALAMKINSIGRRMRRAR